MNKSDFPHRSFFHTDLACLMYSGKILHDARQRNIHLKRLKRELKRNPSIVRKMKEITEDYKSSRMLSYRQALFLYDAIVGFDEE